MSWRFEYCCERRFLGAEGQLPVCGKTTVSKCGKILIWHWAHTRFVIAIRGGKRKDVASDRRGSGQFLEVHRFNLRSFAARRPGCPWSKLTVVPVTRSP